MSTLNWRHRFSIMALAAIAYAPTLRVGFIWDDHFLIEANPFIRRWTFQNVIHDFTLGVFNDPHNLDFYRPLLMLMNRLDFTVWGLHPFGFHLTNLLFHMGNALLLAKFLRRLRLAPLTAFLTSCLFAVHPLVVEQLLMVVGRDELMSYFFLLGCLLFSGHEGLVAGLGGSLSYAFALFSKESAVITPVLLAMVYAIQNQPKKAYLRIIPLVVLTGLYFALHQRVMGQVCPSIDGGRLVRFFWQAFPQVLMTYARLILWPWNLYTDRMLPSHSPAWFVYTFVILVTAAVMLWRKMRWGLFWLGWFVVTLLPKTVMMITQSFLRDHWGYPGMVAILYPISMGFTRGWLSSQREIQQGARLIFYLLLIVWALLVHLNVELRGSDEKQSRWSLRFSSSEVMTFNLGIALLAQGRAADAVPYLEQAYQRDPGDLHIRRMLATAYRARRNAQKIPSSLAGEGAPHLNPPPQGGRMQEKEILHGTHDL